MIPNINLESGKKIYFASDFHLGVPDYSTSQERELRVIAWMREIKVDAAALFLMGDVFDFWFEFKYVVPKGFVRLQAEIASFTDAGIPVYWFTGNHDMWIFSYFEKELGVKMIRTPQSCVFNGKKFYLGHGDGLGPGDRVYKALKHVFANRFFQEWFRVTPASIGIGIANAWSRKSRISGLKKEKYLGDKEWLYLYALEQQKKSHHHYYIFGHRHLPLDISLGEDSRYINLGEWVHYDTYAVFSEQGLQLCSYNNRIEVAAFRP